MWTTPLETSTLLENFRNGRLKQLVETTSSISTGIQPKTNYGFVFRMWTRPRGSMATASRLCWTMRVWTWWFLLLFIHSIFTIRNWFLLKLSFILHTEIPTQVSLSSLGTHSTTMYFKCFKFNFIRVVVTHYYVFAHYCWIIIMSGKNNEWKTLWWNKNENIY